MNLLKPVVIVIFLNFFVNAMESDPIADIKLKYQIKGPNDCQVAISKEIIDPTIGKNLEYIANQQVACLISGYKDIYQGTYDSFEEEVKIMDELLRSRINESDNIGYFEMSYYQPSFKCKANKTFYIYNHLGFINALLLAKHELQRELGQVDPNTYLTGYLLKYKAEDLDFFDAINLFMESYPYKKEIKEYNKASLEKIQNNNFAKWPEKFKEMYNTWEKNEWPKTNVFNELQKRKKDAGNWLARNKSKDAETLKKEINLLGKELIELCRETGLTKIDKEMAKKRTGLSGMTDWQRTEEERINNKLTQTKQKVINLQDQLKALPDLVKELEQNLTRDIKNLEKSKSDLIGQEPKVISIEKMLK